MVLGNTPRRLTPIHLEANKSFALNLRFTNEDDAPYDMTDAVVRLVAKEPPYGHANVPPLIVISMLADHVDDPAGRVQFDLQAADLELVPGEYPYDVTLISAQGYSTPILKGHLVLGENVDPNNLNTYEDIDPGNELEVLLGNSCEVVVCLQHPSKYKEWWDTTWTLVGYANPGDPSGLLNPGSPKNSPLWIDLSEDYHPIGSGDPDWTEPVLLNGWVNYTTPPVTKPLVFRRTGGGIVQVEGVVAPGTLGAPIFNLPTGYRPDDGLITFDAPGAAGACRVSVLPNGDVVHVSGTPGAWMSLSILSFYGEAGIVGEEPEEEDDVFGEHLIVWTGTGWAYRGNVIVSRPPEIPVYTLGARAVWDTTMDAEVTTPPSMAIAGDVWFPHGDVDPLA